MYTPLVMKGRDMRSSSLDHRCTYQEKQVAAPLEQNEARTFSPARSKQGQHSWEHSRILDIRQIHRDSRTSLPQFCAVMYSLNNILPYLRTTPAAVAAFRFARHAKG